MDKENHEEDILPSWLRQQQQQSWQIEILIASGLILFLYSLPHFLINYLIDIQEGNLPRAEEVILFFGTYIFSRALLLGFVVTLFLRSLWLAFLGINYAFPKGINYDRLSYSFYFMKKNLKEKSVTGRIVALEKICSLTFSITIMVTLLTAGLFFFLSLLFYGIYYLFPSIYSQQVYGVVLLAILLLMILGITDWLFFGKLKRFPILSKIYYPFYKLFQWVTLSFLYQQEYLTFISNVKRWKVYSIFLVYFFIAFEISISEISNYFPSLTVLSPLTMEGRSFLHINTFNVIDTKNYDNMLSPESRISWASIQSDVISDNYLKVFVVYLKGYDETLDSLFKENKVQTVLSGKSISLPEIWKNDTLLQTALNMFLQLKIDNKLYDNNSWFFHKHPVTGENGFLTYIPTDSISAGNHDLYINMHLLSDKEFKLSTRKVIPFFVP